MDSSNQKKQQGFTLVEIAIVLVIIGLLLGGVLKGQELINNAKQRSMITDFNGLKVAYYSFQDRYGYLPGDNATAASRNNQLQTANSNVAGDQVAGKFFQDLFTAGFLGKVNPVPDAALATNYRAAYDDTDGAIADKNQVCIVGVQDFRVAEAIDLQLDDGDPANGLVQSKGDPANTYVEANEPFTVCMEL